MENESVNINISLWWGGLWLSGGRGKSCATLQGKTDMNERWRAASPVRINCPQFWGPLVSNDPWVWWWSPWTGACTSVKGHLNEQMFISL